MSRRIALLLAMALSGSATAASHSAARVKHATTVATVVDTVTLTDYCGTFRLQNRSGSQALYFRSDGTDPGVAADESYYVGPGQSRQVNINASGGSIKVVSLLACAYTVECE